MDPEAQDPHAVDGLPRLVGERVRRHLPPDASLGLWDPDADLTDLGLDSLGLAGLIVDLETTFCVVFPEELLVPETLRTVHTVAAALAALQGRAGRRSWGCGR